MKILVATEKPFAKRPWTESVRSSRTPDTNWRCSKKYTDKGQALEAVGRRRRADRPRDKVTAEVIAAAKT